MALALARLCRDTAQVVGGTDHGATGQSMEPENPTESRWIEGVIVGRRVLGKHLAFATLQLCVGEARGDGENEIQRYLGIQEKPELVKVQFRRQAPRADAALPDDAGTTAPKLSAQAIVWEGASANAVEPLRSAREHEHYDPAPFPQRRSQLQLGTRVAAKVCAQAVEGQPSLAVMRWRVVARVGEECPSSVGSVGAGAGAPASAGGPFSVSDRQRVRQLAHSNAVDVRACEVTSGGIGESLAGAPLCKYWMSTGVCEAHQSGRCGGYRKFVCTLRDSIVGGLMLECSNARQLAQAPARGIGAVMQWCSRCRAVAQGTNSRVLRKGNAQSAVGHTGRYRWRQHINYSGFMMPPQLPPPHLLPVL